MMTNRNKRAGGIAAAATLLLLACYLFAVRENNEISPHFSEAEGLIIVAGEIAPHKAEQGDGEVHVPVEFLKRYLDPSAYIDEATASLILTTGDNVIQFKKEALEAFVNEKPFSLSAPVYEKDGAWYVPSAVLEAFYPVEFRTDSETGISVLHDKRVPRETSVVKGEKNGIALRVEASRRAPIAAFVSGGEEIQVLGENGKWVKVQKQGGEFGYIQRRQLGDVTQHGAEQEAPPKTGGRIPEGEPIHLAWEAVYSRNPNTRDLPEMQGVNVVSPTWFELKNGQGDIQSKADSAYVAWAHDRGMQVWALFSNAFDPDRTHEMLASYDKRMHVIKQLLAYAEIYGLDGINIDFEYMHLEDKEELVQFVRELTAYLHQQDLTVSMDVTIHSTSDMWSRFYDREKLAEAVDYIAVMTYDEHPAASAVAGSVASLPWTEAGLVGVLEEVPAEKLLLGIPFYTRIWSETEDGVTSKTLSMKETAAFIKEKELQPKLDEATGQHYAEFTDADGTQKRIWFEDGHSLSQRLELVAKYKLAGIASWQRGFAPDHVWADIEKTLTH